MIRRTPGYHSITIAAGSGWLIRDVGRILKILNIVGATSAMFAIGDESVRPLPVGITIGSKDDSPFDRVEIFNTGLAPITVEIIISNLDVRDNSDLARVITALQQMTPATALTVTGPTLVQQDGVGVTQLLAANAARKWCLVSADLSNANFVYLGVDNTVSIAANSFFDMMAGGTWRENYTGAVWAVSTNGTEQVRVYEST